MARDRASIRIDMWGDGDWRDMPRDAQHLYMLLLSHPTLSYAGVAEWHPGKLAAMTSGVTASDVLAAAVPLEAQGFIVLEQATDEVLVRSFVKHDGLMKQPKLVVSMTTAYAAVASRRIQMVIAGEVQKMRDRDPEMRAWEVKQVQTILAAKADSWSGVGLELTPGFTLEVTPGFTPNVGQGLAEPTTTATATSSKEDRAASRKRPETYLPEDWVASDSHRKYASEHNLDLDHEVHQFRAHAVANDRRQRSWDGAFSQWLGNARKWGRAVERKPETGAWMARTETPEWMKP